jgi:hypothetical protein
MKYNINIPKPCHEDWNAMLPEQKGRHCDACKTVVTDFTIMTDAEIINHLKATASNTCGRFLETQLNRELLEPTKTYHWFNIPKLSTAASILFSLLQLPVFAQVKNEIKTEQTQIQKSDSTKQKLSSDIIIKGTVLRANDYEPMDYVAVRVYLNNEIIAVEYTYENGSFSCKLSSEKYADSIVDIRIKNVGFKEDTIKEIALNKNEIDVGKIFLKRTLPIGNIVVHSTTMGLLTPKNISSNDSLKIDTIKHSEIETLPIRDVNSVVPIYQGMPSSTIQIGGSRQNETRIIIDGVPIKLTPWQRFKRKIRRLF